MIQRTESREWREARILPAPGTRPQAEISRYMEAETYDAAREARVETRWGTGVRRGGFSMVAPE